VAVMLTQVAITSDGKAVMDNVYKLCETHGLPVDVILSLMSERNMVPDWINFFQQAKANGMKHQRIIAKLTGPVAEAYGEDFQTKVFELANKANELGKLYTDDPKDKEKP
jgi:alanyl-tRNA synthetase